jgi:hypothetical protein
MLNCPSLSVLVPVFSGPFTTTLTPSNGLPAASVTLPVTVVLSRTGEKWPAAAFAQKRHCIKSSNVALFNPCRNSNKALRMVLRSGLLFGAIFFMEQLFGFYGD